MNSERIRRALVGCLCLFLAGVSWTSMAEKVPVDEQMEASADGLVEVVNRAGRVVVTGGTDNSVAVTGALGEDTLGLEFERHGSRIVVAVLYPDGDAGRELASDLYITLPTQSTLVVRSVSADIDVTEVHGEQRLKTVSGQVRSEAYAADLEIGSISGDVTVTGHEAAALLSASTVSGDVGGTALAGEIEATSVSGALRLIATDVTRARLKSTSGDIDVTAAMIAGGRLVAESMSGDVGLVMGDDENVSFEAETFSGDIDNCYDEAIAETGYSPGKSLRFSRGSGDRNVRVVSFSGDVDLCAAPSP